MSAHKGAPMSLNTRMKILAFKNPDIQKRIQRF
jgi:hypothetical protein